MTIEMEVRTSMRHSKPKATRRKRPAPGISTEGVTEAPLEEPQVLPLDLFLEDEELGTPLDEAVEADAGWDDIDGQNEEIDGLMPDATTLPEFREGEGDPEDESNVSGVDNPVLLYLQEAGTVPLLKPEDEVRIAKQIVALKAHLREVVQDYGPRLPDAFTAEMTTPTEAEDWVTAVVRHVRSWVIRLEHGEAAAVQREARLSPKKILQLWAAMQEVLAELEETKGAMVNAN